MTDPVASTYLAVIGLCVLPLAYLLPQDPAVTRLLAAVRRWVRRRRLRRWVAATRATAVSTLEVTREHERTIGQGK
jgi:hypothetical protein